MDPFHALNLCLYRSTVTATLLLSLSGTH
jgi:hypothetical protein